MVETVLTEPFKLAVGTVLIIYNTWFERFRNLQNQLYRQFRQFIRLLFVSLNTPVPKLEHPVREHEHLFCGPLPR